MTGDREPWKSRAVEAERMLAAVEAILRNGSLDAEVRIAAVLDVMDGDR